ncbi:MAG TPA: ATP-dependent DNA ligase, partial [Gaiellaceae bacterium]|nr:ATP-dependent DNA ligase [Gaiellaceae bacterium]
MPGKNVPFPPMEAQLVAEIPEGDWLYEPKWDGFRGVVENDSGELRVWSRNGRPLLRYFPELAPLGGKLPPHSALDGEIVLEQKGRLEFDLLQMRLHPAESRVRKLSAEYPVRFIAFDVLLWKGEPVWQQPLAKRRARLERLKLPFAISQASRDPKVARRWLERLEPAGLDGVVCKRLDSPYRPGSREAVVKVKHHKTVDCVVVGVRWKEKPTRLATLLLGLYDGGELHYVGSCAVAPARHDATLELVKPLLDDAPERGFSEPNRWGTGELAESALKPELVAEVRYDKVEKRRIRHGTRFLRFRPDKDPADCT